MDRRWNLDALYTDFQSPELQADMLAFENEINELSVFVDTLHPTNSDAAKQTLSFLQKEDHLLNRISKLLSYAQLTFSVDTKNMEAAKKIEKIEDLLTSASVIDAKFSMFVREIEDIDAFIRSYEGLEDYAFFIREKKVASEHLLSTNEELLLAEMKKTGSSAWAKLQDSIISTLTGDFRGEETMLTVLRAKAYEGDKAVRKDAFEAELEAYKKKDTESCACLNAIKGEVLTVAKKRGYESPLAMSLATSRMDKETLDAMMCAIKEYLPYFRAYLKKKAELLGHTKGLPFYDLFAPVGEVDMRYTYDEARDFIIKQFSTFSHDLGSFAEHAFDNDWIDPFPREGKVAGAFCANLHSIKESRIMSNFSGSFDDVITLAHELGHGYHGDCLKDALPLNADYPMPLAETASIFCETIVFNAAVKNASKEETQIILENELLGATQVIVDIYSRYLFETELFDKRQQASLSVDELKEAMLNAQKEAYGDGLDHQVLHPYMWMCKPHYYDGDYNFYNFPYAFGQLFAKGLYALYEKEGEAFIPKYNNLLIATGCNSIHDVLKIVDIDSHEPDFFRSSLEVIKQSIEAFISL